MKLADIQKTLAESKDHVRKEYKAEIQGIFGSYARGDVHADSDLDLLVEFDPGAGLFKAIGLQHFLEDTFGCKVDVVTRRALREEMRDSVYQEMIRL